MLEEILSAGFSELQISPDAQAISRFRIYHDQLQEKNKVMNLTAISGEEDTARLHFLDSASPLLFRDLDGLKIVDVGTGAGFPGLPLKIIRPSIDLTLIDSLNKRIGFLSETCENLGLSDVKCIHLRAEEGSEYREQFDAAVSRAVARLNVLCELCLPYVKPGGYFFALKGPAIDEELSEAENAIKLLGGRLEEVFNYSIPGLDVSHNIAVIKKISNTPKKYPRKFAQIKKAPLK